MKIKLMPPFLLGRYFQALAIYLSDLEILNYSPDFVEVEDESFERVLMELSEMVDRHLEKVRTQLPLYGNDYRYFFPKVLGKKRWEELRGKEKSAKDHDSRVRLWRELWREVLPNLPKVSTRLAHLQILKASVHKYPREFGKAGKDAEVKNVEDLRGEALAVAGALLSLLGRVQNNVLMLLPPLPESLKENKDFVYSLRSRYSALDGVDLRYPFDKVPCSSDILLQFIFAKEFRDKFAERINCLEPLDNLFVASTATGGNRPMINSIIPLMASEIACKLGKSEVLNTLLKQLKADPEVAGMCVNDLFQYVVSGNPAHLYNCARRYADNLASSEEVKKKTAIKTLIELSKVIS